MNKTLTEIKNEFEEKFAENLSGTGLQRPPYITKYTYVDEIWTWFEPKIKETISQTKQELIEKERKKLKHNIGMLRQWLNEKSDGCLITNQDLEDWLLENRK